MFLETKKDIDKQVKKKKKKETAAKKPQSSSASVEKVNKRLSEKYSGGSTGGKISKPSRSTESQNRITQKSYGTTKPTITQRTTSGSTAQRQQNAERNNNLKQTMGQQARENRISRLEEERQQRQAQQEKARRTTGAVNRRLSQKYGENQVTGGRRTKLDSAADYTRDVAKGAWQGAKLAATEDAAFLNRFSNESSGNKFWNRELNQEDYEKNMHRLELRQEGFRKKIKDQQEEMQRTAEESHSRLGRLGIEAAQSAGGMAVDAMFGPFSLVHMGARVTEGAQGDVIEKAEPLKERMRQAGYSEEEINERFKGLERADFANAIMQGTIEGLTEKMFGGIGLASKVGGRGYLDRAIGKLAGGRLGSGIAGRVARGTLEEIAEEEVGNPAQALASNVIYGNNFQGINEDIARRSLDELMAASANVDSEDFYKEARNAFKESGSSDEEANELAEMARRYLQAQLSGDSESAQSYQDQMVKRLTGGENSLKEKWTLQDAIDVGLSTAMMTVATGVPGALTTAAIGSTYKEENGLDGVRKLTEVVKNLDPDNSTKAQAILDRIDAGEDISNTQVYDVMDLSSKAAAKAKEREAVKNRLSARQMQEEDLFVQPAVITRAGYQLGVTTEQRFEEISDRVLDRVGEESEDSYAIADAVAAYETGTITAEQMNALNIENPENRTVFQEMTGIDLNQFNVTDSRGKIDEAASNTKMQTALFANAAENYVQSARIEQENWNDKVRGMTAEAMSPGLGGEGDKAFQKAMESVDPRDRAKFMLTDAAARRVYEYARNTTDEWSDVRRDFRSMFKGVDESVLRDVFDAAKKDKTVAETQYYGQIVNRNSLTSDVAFTEGKFRSDSQRPLGNTELSTLSTIASELGVDVIMSDALAAYENGRYSPKQRTITLNAANTMGDNLSFVFSHEVTHHLAAYAPDEYIKLSRFIMDTWYKNNEAEYNAEIEKIQRLYKEKKGRDLTPEQALEEIIANNAHNFWADEEFMDAVTKNEPTLAQSIINAIREFLRKLRNILASETITDERTREGLFAEIGAYDEAYRMWLTAFNAAKKVRATDAINDLQERIYEEERTRNSISDGLNIQNGNARWTDERIDDLIERYGASNPDYSQAYAVLMNPRDFLHITIEDELLRKWRESAASQPEGLTYKEGQRAVWDKSYLEGRLLDDQNFPLDEAELRGQAQTPFLYIRSNKSGQRVLGHEGRHRMRALMEAGVTSVPVVIEDPDTKTSKQNVDSMILGYQEDVYNGAGIVEVNDLVPIKESNRDELIQMFGGEADVRFSISSTEMTAGEERDFKFGDEDVRYSIREEDPPKNTKVGYKVFYAKNGNLYPPMVANPEGADTPIGVWLNADEGQRIANSKTGRPQVKAGGKGTQGSSGSLAYRPGWHLGEIPLAKQFARMNPETGIKDMFPADFVWAECEIAADVDYQEEAMSYGYTENGKFRHSYAGLPKIPKDGYYTYRTNPNPDTVPWMITGAMKVNRLLSDDEVAQILEEQGIEAPLRQGGNKTLEELGFAGGTDARYSISEERREELNKDGVDVTEGGSAVKYSLNSWDNTDIEALKKKLLSAGFDNKRIDKWIKDVNSIAALIAGDMNRLNYAADEYQDALKPNAEYYYTLDLSTLCQKRRLYQGTYNKIMHHLINQVLMPEDTLRLRQMMDEMGYQVPCGICYEESRKKNEGKFAQRWLNGYGKRWKGYKNQEHDDPYIPTLNEVTTTDGREKLREEHPEAYESYVNYQKTRGSANPKISYTHTDYRGDILRMTESEIEKVKHIGGLRIQSFSDFEIPHVIDMMQAVMDMSAKELTAQAYTKVPAFADIFGGTGIKINLSLIGRWNEETQQLEFDAKEGIDPAEAFRIRDKYSANVGTILVGADDVSILKAWADSRVDMVIPFHRSGWGKKDFEKLGLVGYKDFTKGQTERYMMGKKDMALSTASKQLGLTGDQKLEGIYAEDYWDYNKSGKENAEAYLKLCAEKHYRPVFYQFLHDNGDGTWSLQEDGSTDGYWKSLIDFKMYDNDGKGSPQVLVEPNFDMDAARSVMDAYEGGADTLPVADEVVDKFLKEYAENHPGTRYSLTDTMIDDQYMAAVNSGNMEEAQRLVNEAAERAGYTTRAYHGTPWGGFTEFNTNFLHAGRTFGNGIYLTSSPTVAEGYTFPNARDYARIQAGEEPTPQVYGLFIKDLSNALVFDWENYTYNGRKVKGVNSKLAMIQMDIEAEPDKDVVIRNIRDGSEELSDVYVIKNSSSLKSADPVTYAEDGSVIPLSERFDPNNDDIRYSLSTQDADGNILSDGQMEFFKNSQARDEQGRLVPVYHGTNQGGFTIFDPLASDDFRTLFFTSNFNVAMTYASADYRLPGNEERNPIARMYNGPFSSMEDFLSNANELYSEAYGWDSSQPVMKNLKAVVFDSKTSKHSTNIDDITEWLQGDSERFDTIEIMLPTMDEGSYSRRKDISASSVEELLATINTNIENAAGKNTRNFKSGYYQVYLNLENPMIVNANGAAFDEILYDGDYYDTRGLAEVAYNNGYDGVIISNCLDINGASMEYSDEELLSDIFIAFSSNQVKDTRNENPTENPDIRYSLFPEDEIHDRWAKSVSDIKDIPLRDPVLEENRIRYSIAADDFVNDITTSWDRRERNLTQDVKDTPLKNKLISLIRQTREGSGTDRQYKAETLEATIKSARKMYHFAENDMAKNFAEEAWNAAERIVDDIDYNDDYYEEYKGIKAFFDKTKIFVPDTLMYDEAFMDFYRDNRGRMMLFDDEGIEIETAYKLLRKKFPSVFTEDIEHPVDMLIQMDYVLDYVEPYKDAYTSEEHTKLVEDIARNLCDIVDNIDEYNATINELNVSAMKQRHEEALRKVTSEERAKTSRQKERAENWKRKYNERVQKDVRDRKEKKERREHRDRFDRISDNYNALVKWVLKPDKNHYVPEEFRRTLAEVLQTLDLQTENSKKLEEKTGHPALKTLKMRELKDQLIKLSETPTENGTPLFDIDNHIPALLDALAEKLDKNGNTIDALDAHDILEIDRLFTSIRKNIQNYNNLVYETKMIPLNERGQQVISDQERNIKRRGKAKIYDGGIGKMYKNLNVTSLTPPYFFDRLGEGMKTAYEELRYDGFDTYVRNERMIIDKIAGVLSKYYKTGGLLHSKSKPGSTIEDWRDDRSAKTIELESGASVRMTAAQIMSFYCLYRRKQAAEHMIDGAGIYVTPIQLGAKMAKAKALVKGRTDESGNQHITDTDAKNIIAKLTPDQKQVADELQRIMAVDMARLGNQAHRLMYGYEIFGDPDYFPIKVHGNELAKNINDIGDVYEKIKSFGPAKPLTPGAKNVIEIDDIFSVVADHCNGMNLYNAYLVPISNFMKVYNYRTIDEGGNATSVQEALERANGEEAMKYITNFLVDLNGIKKASRGGVEDIMDRALGRAKMGAVFGNARVALQQPTAYVRAAAEINAKYLMPFIKVRPGRGVLQEMYQYCPIAQWKAWGYYDTYMGRDLEDVMMNKWSRKEVALAGIYGMLDNMTWGAIWQAVKAEQHDLHPDMDMKSEEFLNMCGRRASEVFDRTQVVDSTFHRSDAMRNKDKAVKAFTAFMSEPTLTLNMIRGAIYQAGEAKIDGHKGKAFGIMAKAISVFLVQAAVVSAAQALADAWRDKDPGWPGDDDDDDEKALGYWERWLHNFVADLFDQLHLENNVYLVKDVMPYINYILSKITEPIDDVHPLIPWARAVLGWDSDYLYSNNNIVMSSLENTARGIEQVINKMEKGEEYDKKWYDVMQKTLSGPGTLFFGFPIGTLMKDFKPILQKVIELTFAADGSLMDRFGGSSDDDDEIQESKPGLVSRIKGAVTGEEPYDVETQAFTVNSRNTKAKQKVDADAEALQKLADGAADKVADKAPGSETNEALWDYLADGYTKRLEAGDFDYLNELRDIYEANGGNVATWDKKITEGCRRSYKKTISTEQTSEQELAQDKMYNWMISHGVGEQEISKMCYKSDTARDLKAAMRLNDEDFMVEEMTALFKAGISKDDIYKLYENRNRGANTYDGKYAEYMKSTGTYIWPTQGSITSDFGYRTAASTNGVGSTDHKGIDIGADTGTPVTAADGGTVIMAQWYAGYGKTIQIQHDDGTITQYSHLSWWDPDVGDVVTKGQEIGKVGSTGDSTGPHLHFEITKNGEPVNPMDYLS